MKKVNISRWMKLAKGSGFFTPSELEAAAMEYIPPVVFHRNEIVTKSTVPYIRLLEKAYDRDVTLRDETVTRANNSADIRALKLAKKQYVLMQKGLSEEDAYQKALEFVNELEDTAFSNMKEVLEEINKMGDTASSITEPHVAKELEAWREVLKGQSYKSLSLAQQGQLDRFVQMEILKWTEVEREQRMKDVVFYNLFENLLSALFPLGPEYAKAEEKKFKNAFSSRFLSLYGYNVKDIKSAKPFFVEDYLSFLQQVKSKPDLSTWGEADLARLESWICDSAAINAGLNVEKQSYVSFLLYQYFPIALLRNRASTFEIPTIQQVRQALYRNQVGYKQIDGKMFVKRFYLIPSLLFPLDVACSKVASDVETLGQVAYDKSVLAKIIKEVGLPPSSDSTVLEIIEDNLEHISLNFQRQQSAIEALEGRYKPVSLIPDHSALGAMLDDPAGSGDLKLQNPFDLENQTEVRGGTEGALGEEESEGLTKEEEEALLAFIDDPELAQIYHQSKEEKWSEERWEQEFAKMKDSSLPEEPSVPPSEFKTDLEKERTAFLAQMEFSNDKMAVGSPAMKEYRKQSEILVRARLQVIFEKKETARRIEDSRRRGVIFDELPPIEAPISLSGDA